MSRYDGLDGTDDSTAPRREVSKYIGGRSANSKGGQVPNAEVHNSNRGGRDQTLYSGQRGQGSARGGGDRNLYNGLFGSCTAAIGCVWCPAISTGAACFGDAISVSPGFCITSAAEGCAWLEPVPAEPSWKCQPGFGAIRFSG